MKKLLILSFLLLMTANPLHGQVSTISSPLTLGIRNGTGDPAACAETSLNIFLNRTTNLVKYCDNGSWISLATSVSPSFTGQVNLSDGTAAEPSWGWTSDDDATGTGMFRGCANCLSFVTNGVERWIINASGSFVPIADNTYDIGNGTVDPRDINAARNLIIGGTSALTGHVGITTTPSASTGVLLLAREDGNQVTVGVIQNGDAASANSANCWRTLADVSTLQMCSYGTGNTATIGGEALAASTTINTTAGNGMGIVTTGVRPLWVAVNSIRALRFDGTNPHPSFTNSHKIVTTQFDKTSDTTLANVTGLSVTLTATKKYRFSANISTTSNAGGGIKFAVAGTATATAVRYSARCTETGYITIGTARATALAAAVGDVTAVTAAECTITGYIEVNAAGTLTIQFAQNASNGTASSVLVGSDFLVFEVQ